MIVWVAAAVEAAVAADKPAFRSGVEALEAGEFSNAAQFFRQSLAEQPSHGAWLNLGLAEWHRGRAGEAVLAWENSAWLNPWDGAARNNLKYAQQAAQLEEPELTWYETASTWLPADDWAWVLSLSLWLAVGLMVLPGVCRARKAGWHQPIAALALGIFLLSLAPNFGVVTRAHLGIVLDKNAKLRLTPTTEGEVVATLADGESVRQLRRRGEFLYVQTPHGKGWMSRTQVGLMSGG